MKAPTAAPRYTRSTLGATASGPSVGIRGSSVTPKALVDLAAFGTYGTSSVSQMVGMQRAAFQQGVMPNPFSTLGNITPRPQGASPTTPVPSLPDTGAGAAIQSIGKALTAGLQRFIKRSPEGTSVDPSSVFDSGVGPDYSPGYSPGAGMDYNPFGGTSSNFDWAPFKQGGKVTKLMRRR